MFPGIISGGFITDAAVVFIPMLFLLPLLFGLQGAWMAMPVADGCTLVVSFIFLLMIHRELRRRKPHAGYFFGT